MLTLNQVKANSQIKEFIHQTDIALSYLGYTDHGFRHVTIVADRAKSLARKIGLNKQDQELSAIAGYCHDMANFLSRDMHHYLGAVLFSQIFLGQTAQPEEVTKVMQAIVCHDKAELKILNKIAAVVILADKSDAHRSRVKIKDLKKINYDIHDRVNYAVTDNHLVVNGKSKEIVLKLKIDTKIIPVLEYFEIFTERMSFCRQAAEYLGYKFRLEINRFKLL